MATNVPNYGTTIQIWGSGNVIQLVSGPDCVADALLTRLQTKYLFYDPNFGFDVNSLVNADVAGGNIAALVSRRVEAECLKDDRVNAADVSVGLDGIGGISINIVVTLSGGEQFTLVGKRLSAISVDELMAFSVLGKAA